jgi:uncharacterized membrane protein
MFSYFGFALTLVGISYEEPLMFTVIKKPLTTYTVLTTLIDRFHLLIYNKNSRNYLPKVYTYFVTIYCLFKTLNIYYLPPHKPFLMLRSEQ